LKQYTDLEVAQFQIVALRQAAGFALDAMVRVDEDSQLEADCEEPECAECATWRPMWEAIEVLKRVLKETK
jgi:hypothetical protein